MSIPHTIKIVSYIEVLKKALKCLGITPHVSVYEILRNYVDYHYEKTERGNVSVIPGTLDRYDENTEVWERPKRACVDDVENECSSDDWNVTTLIEMHEMQLSGRMYNDCVHSEMISILEERLVDTSKTTTGWIMMSE